MLQVTRKSILTGKTTTMLLPITQEQLDLYENSKVFIQDAFPNLDKHDREFIKTGITKQEWTKLILDSSTMNEGEI